MPARPSDKGNLVARQGLTECDGNWTV